MREPSSNLLLSAAGAAVHTSSLSDSSLSAWLTALKTADGTTRSAGGISLAAAVERASKDILTSPVLVEAVLSDTHLFECRQQILAPLFGEQVEKQYVKDVLERAALLVDDEACSHLAAWLVKRLVTEVRCATPKGWLLERWPYRWTYVTGQLDGWDGGDPRRRFLAALHETDTEITEDGECISIPSDQINATAQGRTKKEAEALAAAALICDIMQGTFGNYEGKWSFIQRF
jgi:hypothetical protein